LRVVARGGEVVPDPSATLPGRGAWVHPSVSCIELASKRKAFGRALKVTGALDVERVLTVARQIPTIEMAD
jgi:predicted RNA-binding protein YlxR (DUF448 family)